MEASLLLWGAFAFFEMPVALSLGVVVVISGVSVAASWRTARRTGAGHDTGPSDHPARPTPLEA